LKEPGVLVATVRFAKRIIPMCIHTAAMNRITPISRAIDMASSPSQFAGFNGTQNRFVPREETLRLNGEGLKAPQSMPWLPG
jgi:hypothetical protein